MEDEYDLVIIGAGIGLSILTSLRLSSFTYLLLYPFPSRTV